MFEVAVSLAAAATVFVLPGLGLLTLLRAADRLRGRGASPVLVESRPLVEALVLATASSMISLAVLGAVLIGARAFSYAAIGALTTALALCGLPALYSLLRRARGEWFVGAALFLLSIPFIWTSLRANHTPTHSYQWFYWDLGRQLDIAGGVPRSVLEFGLAVRWHPDYVLAVIPTAAYHALTFPIGELAAIGTYRVPVFLLGVGATYVVFRLWVSRAPALIGVAAASATTLYITKFDAYKPESLGLAAGLLATWLLVVGVRRRSRELMLVGGALFGVAVGMHGIAAAVTGMLAVCAVLVEIWDLAPERRRRTLANGLRAGALAVVIVLATGLALQGRAVVASDAGHPVLENGQDPTWVFLNRHDGTFYFPPQPTVWSQASETLEHPWPGGLVADWGWAVGAAIVLAAMALSLRLGGRRRRAATALLGSVGLIAAAMLFFGLKFHTFIPQHTGLTRIAIYLGLFYGMGIALAADLGLRWLRRFDLDRFQIGAIAVAAVVFVGSWAVGVSLISLNKYGGVGDEGQAALAALEGREKGPDEAVLSNISSRGLIEFETGLEVPVEGRQPVIEDPDFLTDANAALVEIHRFFDHPTDPALLRRLGVRWLLVSNGSRGLGSPFNLGLPSGEADRLEAAPFAQPVWRSHNLELFRVKGPVSKLEPVGPSKALGGRVLLALATLAAAVWLLRAPRLRRPWRRPALGA